MDFKQHLIVAAKGAVVGGTMLVPGVSSGTVCIILGVYDRLIHAVSTFFQSKRANFWLLFCFCLGAGAGIFLLSKPLLQLMELFPKPASFFFMGAVAGSVPMTFQKAKVTSFHWRVPVYVVAGMIIVWVLAKLPTMDQMSGGGPGALRHAGGVRRGGGGGPGSAGDQRVLPAAGAGDVQYHHPGHREFGFLSTSSPWGWGEFWGWWPPPRRWSI